MAYSEFEQSFMDGISRAYFPGEQVEQQPAAEPVKLAAAPAATMNDVAPGGAMDMSGTASSQPLPEMKAYDPTMRERLASFIQAGFEGLGMERSSARKNAQSIIGGPSSGGPLGLGIADIIPFLGTALQTEEAGRSLSNAATLANQGDMTGAAIEGAVGAIGLVPGAAGTIKAGKQVVNATKDLPVGLSIKNVGPPVGSINFNPKKEVQTAIEAIGASPDTAIYLPQAQRAPSVALRIAQPQIIGTGEKGIVTVADVGSVLEKTQLSFNKGKVLDPSNPKDLVKMVDSASAEAQFQLSQPISGATWYEDDVATAFKLSSKVVPQLATDEPLRVLTTAFAASTSYNKRAGENWAVATRIADHLMKTGTIAARNPDNGKLWGGTTGPIMEQQLKLHEYMINKMGLDGYAEWLLSPHTVKEIAAMRAESGLYKTPGIPGKANDMKMGAFIMGEKGGAFFLNLNGIKETTADKWFTRTYNRHTGTLTSGPISEQGLVDAPRNESERALMKNWNRAVAQNVNLDEQANQAVLWYFEQSLYYNLGVKSAKSESFSDGAKNLLNARGIAIDDVAGAGAAGGSDAGQAAAKPRRATAARNNVGGRSAAPTESANPSTVTGGQAAPAMGAE